MDTRVIDIAGLQALIDALVARGYTVIGPTVRDGAIVNGPVSRVDDLPRGWGDEQDAGALPAAPRDDERSSASPPGRSRRSRCSSRPTSCSGAAAARATGSPSDTGARRRGPRDEPTGDGALRPARRALLRPGRRRHPRHRADGPRLHGRALRRAARRRVRRRGEPARTPAARASASRWAPAPGPSPGAGRAVRPVADRAARRRVTGSSSRSAASAGRSVLDERRRTAGDRMDEVRGGRRGREHGRPGGWAAPWTPTGSRSCCTPSAESPDLGRRRLPLPGLHQLHDGLPDLLLHHRRGRHRPHRRRRRARTGSGTRASTPTSPTSTAARCASRRSRATGSG